MLPFRLRTLPTALALITFVLTPLFVTVDSATTPEIDRVELERDRLTLRIRGDSRQQVAVETGSALRDLTITERLILPEDGSFDEFLQDLATGTDRFFLRARSGPGLTVPTFSVGYPDAPGMRRTSSARVDVTISDGQDLAALEVIFDPEGAANAGDFLGQFEDGELQLDPGDFTSLNGGSSLADGSHRFRVEATDVDGNTGSTQTTFILDTTPPTVVSSPADAAAPLRETFSRAVTLRFSEPLRMESVSVDDFSLSGQETGTVALDGVAQPNSRRVELLLADALPDDTYTLSIPGAITDRAGNPLSGSTQFSFTIADPPGIDQFSPADGARMVNVALEPIVRFDEPVDPASVDALAIRVLDGGEPLAGELRVSTTERFVTFFPLRPFPASTLLALEIHGDRIVGRDGLALDADGDNEPGGTLRSTFETLPLDRIEGTNVFGFVLDSTTDQPLEGATIRLDAFPEVSAVSDANGRFLLEDVPAPVFFAVIDGSTVTNVPEGKFYPTLGKSFASVAGQEVQIAVNGQPFDIHLPLMDEGDIVDLNENSSTAVGFGPAAMQAAQQMLPGVDAAALAALSVEFPPGSAQDNAGNPATEAMVVPVPPNRLPGELPPFLQNDLVITVQAGSDGNFNSNGGSSRFDVPAPITLPNLQGLEPGSRTQIYSFNHDKGIFEPTAVAVVSDDGETLSSLPGEGLSNPGWHSSDQTSDEPIQLPPRYRDKGGGGGSDGGGGGGGGSGGSEGSNANVAEKLEKAKRHALAGIYNFGSAVARVATFGLSGAARRATDSGFDGAGAARDIAVDAADDGSVGPDTVRGISNDFGGDVVAANGSAAELDAQVTGMISDMESAEDNLAKSADLLSEVITTNSVDRRKRPAPLSSHSPSTTLEDIARNEWPALESTVHRLADGLRALHDGLSGFTDVLTVAHQQTTNDPELIDDFLTAAERLEDAHRLVVVEGPGSFTALTEQMREQGRAIQEIIEENELIETFSSADAYFQIRAVAGGDVVARGQLDASGRITARLRPRTQFLVQLADPLNNTYAEVRFYSSAIGESADPVRMQLTQPVDNRIDSDGDRILDRIEDALVTDPSKADTDGDGIADLAEYQQGSNPADGRGFPTGIVSTAALASAAEDVAVVEDPTSGAGQTAYVATHNGLTIVDASNIGRLVVQGAITLPGESLEVAVDPLLQVAVVTADDDGLHFVDVSSPSAPTLLGTKPFDAEHVVVRGGVVYVTGHGPDSPSDDNDIEESFLRTYDVFTQNLIAEKSLARSGHALAVARQGIFLKSRGFAEIERFPLSADLAGVPDEPTVAEDIDGSAFEPRIVVGTDRVYATRYDGNRVTVFELTEDGLTENFTVGAAIFGPFDLSDPDLAVVAGTTSSPENSDLFLQDVSSENGAGLVSYTTPGKVTGVAVASGTALITDGDSGLHAVNYQPFDTGGQAPTVQLATDALDVDTETPGIQVVRGSTLQVFADADDDQQVRNVQFIRNGVIVRNDVDFPFEAPLVARGSNAAPDIFSVRARAVDTGGNRATTRATTFDLVADTDDPNLDDFASRVGADGRRMLELTFSEPMDDATLTNGNLTLTAPSGTAIPFTARRQVQRDDSARVSLIYEPLPEEGDYTLTVESAAVADRAGNILGTAPQDFTVTVSNPRPTANLDAPTSPVATSSPVVSIGFSESMDPATLRVPEPVRLENGGTSHAPADSQVVNVSQGLEAAFSGVPAGTYDVVLDSDSVTDREGKPVAPGQDTILGTIEVQTDNTGPVLTGTTITVNQFGGREVVLSFDEPLLPAVVTASEFSVVDANGAPAASITPRRDDLGRQVKLRLAPGLPDGTRLALDPANTTDAAGNPITGPSDALETPAITGSDPDDGGGVFSDRGTVTLDFSEALDAAAFDSGHFILENEADGSTQAPDSVTALNSDTRAELDFGSVLAPGQYELRIDTHRMPDADDDLPLGLTPAVRTFQVFSGDFEILARTPNDGDSVRAVFGNLTITFSEALDPSTVTQGNFTLTDPLGNVVAPESLGLAANDERVEIAYPILSAGEHVFTVQADQLLSAAGTPLGAGAEMIAFTVQGTPATLFPHPLLQDTGNHLQVVDFDGDGIDDLLSAAGSQGLLITLGDGGGLFTPSAAGDEFSPPGQIFVPGSALAVDTADFDEDGHLDLAVAQDGDGDWGVSIHPGDGQGSASDSPNHTTFDSARTPASILAGDFNGDDHADALTLNFGESAIALFAGDGTGNLASPTTLHEAADPVTGFVSADFNGDEETDIALATTAGTELLLADGSGGFQSPQSIGAAAELIVHGDFNGDEEPDLALVTTGPDEAVILTNDGQASFTAGSPIPLPSTPRTVIDDFFPPTFLPHTAAAADVTGSGAVDLIVATNANSVLALTGDGQGGFSTVSEIMVAAGGDDAPLNSLTVGSFDGDGHDDIFVTDIRVGTRVLRNDGSGLLTGTAVDTLPGSSSSDDLPWAASDVNGDTRPDLIAAATETGGSFPTILSVLTNDGGGAYSQSASISRDFSTLAVADFNDDEVGDMVVIDAGIDSVVHVYLGAGDGTFGSPETIDIAANVDATVATGDFNTDGNVDCALHGAGEILLLPGNGDGTFGAVTELVTETASILRAGDFNDNGFPGLALVDFDAGEIRFLLNDGAGTLASVDGPFSPPHASKDLFVGDLDGDGDVDAVSANPGSGDGGTVSLFLNDGSGSFTLDRSLTVENFPDDFLGPRNNPKRVVMADVNGDSLPDLVSFNNREFQVRTLSVFVRKGDGSFTRPFLFDGGFAPFDAGRLIPADFDQQGGIDLAISGLRDGEIRVLPSSAGR